MGPAPLSGCQSPPIRGTHPRQPWKLQGYMVTPVCSPSLSRQLSFRVHLASLSPPLINAHQTDTPWVSRCGREMRWLSGNERQMHKETLKDGYQATGSGTRLRKLSDKVT